MAKKEKEKRQQKKMADEKIFSDIVEVRNRFHRLDRKLEESIIDQEEQMGKQSSRFFIELIVVAAIVLIALATLEIWTSYKLYSQLEVLESDVMSETSNESSYETYLELAFPSNGTLYEPVSEDIAFYSDPDCTNKINNVKFVSFYGEDVLLHDSSKVYCYRMSNGEICYSRQALSYNDFIECK